MNEMPQLPKPRSIYGGEYYEASVIREYHERMRAYGRLCRAGREDVALPPKLSIHASGGLSGVNDYRCGDRIISMSMDDALKWNDSIDEVESILRRLSPQAGGSDGT